MNHKSFFKMCQVLIGHILGTAILFFFRLRSQPVALEPCDPGSMLGFSQLQPGHSLEDLMAEVEL